MNTYDILKVVGQVILPALITCAVTVMKALNVPDLDTIHIIMTAVLTCYNSIIVVWNSNYYKQLAKQNDKNEVYG